MGKLVNCPRCDERSFEQLATHSHCLCCNYSPDLLNYKKSSVRLSGDDLPIPPWAAKAVEQEHSKQSDFTGKENLKEKKILTKKRKAA